MVRPIVDQERMLACIHCGFCLPSCPTYAELLDEADSPRGRIYYLRAMMEGRVKPTPEIKEHLSRCLACLSCESACPSGVKYRELISDARAWLAQNSPVPSPFLWRPFFLHVLPYARRLRLALAPLWVAQSLGMGAFAAGVIRGLKLGWVSRAMRFLPARVPAPLLKPLPEVLPAAGAKRMRVGFMLGCVMEGFLPDLNRTMIGILRHLGCEVVVPHGQGCCGALARHAGDKKKAARLGAKLARVFARADVDVVVANAAGCGADLRELGESLGPEGAALAGKVRDFTEVAAELARRIPPTKRIPLRVAYQDACHLKHAQKITDPPRELLRAVPGLTLSELEEQDICCGSAGVYNILQSEIGEALRHRKLEHIRLAKVDAVVTANPGCLLQLGGGLADLDDAPRLMHIAELLAQAYGL